MDYIRLYDIQKEFKVSIQTVKTICTKLGIQKVNQNRGVYVKNTDFERIRNYLNNSNRVKKIIDLDREEVKCKTDEEKVFKMTIEHLEDKISFLEKQLHFKDQEISSFHNIIANKEKEIKQLGNSLLLAEQAKEDLKQKEDELEIIQEREQKLQQELIEERKSKCVVVEELNNLKNKSLFGRVVAAIKGF
ncbi:hypothetical protein P5E71_15005 [Clostridium perfringens]|nr:hypothetical protein [Clostridium perfringens]MDK0850260.1 hypothetical protein [Clostridium perfringens]MDM0743543.1 hypothetical protein [Clostridium perfringens]